MDESSIAVKHLHQSPSRKRRRARRRQMFKQQLMLHDENNRKGYVFEREIFCGLSLKYKLGENWPRKHVLSREYDANTLSDLFEEIKSVNVGLNFEIDWCALTKLREILTKLAQRHSSAPYKYVAWHYASKVPTNNKRKRRCENQKETQDAKKICLTGASNTNSMISIGDEDSLSSLLMHADQIRGGSQCRVRQSNMHHAIHSDSIFQYLISCIRHTVPDEYFGCHHNKKIFINNWLPVLLGVPGRKSVALGRLMVGVKITKIPWAQEVISCGGRGKHGYVVSKVWLWLLQKYLARLLHCHFVYVEVSGAGDIQRAFFAKRVWQSWTESAVTAHTSAEGSEKKDKKLPIRGWILSRASAEEQLYLDQSRESPLTSILRFAVKKHGVRPIIKVRYLPEDEVLKRSSQALLRYLMVGSPSNDPICKLSKAWEKFYKLRREFLRGGRNESQKDGPHLFVVKVDFEDAYGSIVHKKLCEILSEKLQQAGLKSCSMVRVKKMKCYKKLPNGKGFYRERYELEGLQTKSVSEQGSSLSEWSTIWRKNFQIELLFSFIKKCISKQFIKHGRQLYHLSRGVAQGSIFSSQLWDIYQDHLMAKHILPCIKDVAAELICGADDILFLTNSQEKAKWFLKRMMQGFEDYNAYINPSKIHTNLKDCGVAGMDFITFWGFSLDPVNFRIVPNYGGYPGRRDLINALKLRVLKDPWRLLETRQLCGETKMCFLTLNVDFNGQRVILCNVFRAALLMAANFHAIVKVLFKLLGVKVKRYNKKRVSDQQSAVNTLQDKHLSDVTVDHITSGSNSGRGSIKYCNNQVLLTKFIQIRVKLFTQNINNCVEKYDLNEMPAREEIMWLAYTAFRVTLGKNGGYYQAVLKKITRICENISKQMLDDQITDLQNIVRLCQRCDF